MEIVGVLLVSVPVLFVGGVILLVVRRYRKGREQTATVSAEPGFATYVEKNLAPPQFASMFPEGSKGSGKGEAPAGEGDSAKS